MRFVPTPLPGAYVVEPEPHLDERGLFARTWCEREFAEHGLNARLVQCSVSFSERAGTVRGMHLQLPPHAETKLVRCTRGAIYDIIIDLRPESATYTKWFGVELTAEDRRALYVPEGFAHGLQTLVDGTEVLYQMSEFFASGAARTLRWSDPAFGIRWPQPVSVIAPRDAEAPDFDPAGPLA